MSRSEVAIRPLGDRALLVELGPGEVLDVGRSVLDLFHALDSAALSGVEDLVPAVTSLMVIFDPLRLEPEALERSIADALAAVPSPSSEPSTILSIPVVYGGRHGPDLRSVADLHGLSEAEVVRLHAQKEYRVVMVGFMPGFPYLAGLPPELETPRRGTPRAQVPRGSVAIAGRQTGIYPAPSPGGWQLLGWTPLSLFDACRSPPALLAAGDTVRFLPVTEPEALSWRS